MKCNSSLPEYDQKQVRRNRFEWLVFCGTKELQNAICKDTKLIECVYGLNSCPETNNVRNCKQNECVETATKQLYFRSSSKELFLQFDIIEKCCFCINDVFNL